jgi:hypothetical protein
VATQTLTLLFTDIEGSPALVARLGDAWAGALAGHHRLIGAAPIAPGGYGRPSRRCCHWITRCC